MEVLSTNGSLNILWFNHYKTFREREEEKICRLNSECLLIYFNRPNIKNPLYSVKQ